MKAKISLIALPFFVMQNYFSFAQEKSTNDKTEIFIVYEELSDKQYEDFDNIVASISGLENTYYCQKLNCYAFSYDHDQFKTKGEALDLLIKNTRNFRPIVKDDTNLEILRSNCK